MLKKLALAASCIYCCFLSADPSPFGISLGQTTVEGIKQELIEKPVLASLENVSGYSELFLRSNVFSINDCVPIMAKGFKNNETNTVDAIALEYRANLSYELRALLDRKYVRTYTRKTFFSGVSEIEYINGNCLIRITKTFSGHTVLLYGTIRWFNSYDESHKQLKEIRKMRRDNLERIRQIEFKQKRSEKYRPEFRRPEHRDFIEADHHLFKKCHPEPEFIGQYHHPKKHMPAMRRERPREIFDESLFNEIFSDSFNKFFDDDFFKEDIKPIEIKKSLSTDKASENPQSQTYNFSQTYSNVNGIEELKRNDNGDITEVLKTPEKITVTHNGVTKNISSDDLKAAGNIVNLARELDPNCNIEVIFADDNAKIPTQPKEIKKCCKTSEGDPCLYEKSAGRHNPDPRVKYCQPPRKEIFLPEPREVVPPHKEMQSSPKEDFPPKSLEAEVLPQNDLILYGQRLDNVNL